MWVALGNIPHHSQHTGASHCHSNVCHNTACHSSRNKSCRPGVHGRYCRRNKLGATVYHIRPFQHRWLGLPPSYSVCTPRLLQFSAVSILERLVLSEQEDTFSLCRRPCEFCNQFRTCCQSTMVCSLLQMSLCGS